MNKFQHKLRMFIAAGSAVGFLGGWALLAHAGKPVTTTVDAAPAVESVTLPPLDFNTLEANGSSTNSNVQPFTVQPQPQTFRRPRLRTSAS